MLRLPLLRWYLLTVSLCLVQALRASAPATRLEWADVPAIEARIHAPIFPNRTFAITEFGAKAGDAFDSLPAVRAAIEKCHAAGGGHVLVPAGTYALNGPIHLQSNVDLHLAEGAVLQFSGNPADFLPVVLTRWEGTILYNYSPLIYARGQENIAITGRGVIDGNARHTFAGWVKQQGPAQNRSRQMNTEGVLVAQRTFGEGQFLRPGMIEPYECRNVLVEGVALRDSPFWVVHPIFCSNVTVRGVTVDSLTINNDGCDPDSCTDVLIEDCVFHTGDDGIAIKAGRDADAWRDARPTDNVVIRRCRFQSKINGICIGSEMSAGVRHVFVEDCHVETGESCLYFKSNRDRGGAIENVRVRRVRVDHSKAAVIRFETNYHSYRGGKSPTAYRDFVISDLQVDDATAYGFYAEGVAELPIQDVTLIDVTINRAREPLFLRSIRQLQLKNVRVNGQLLPENPPETPADAPRLNLRY